ncbi:hypothetical protein BDV93DRAFT_515611 [Ceratobasidium sp. AG-I]|nr:hypothetical protein BDV93DRAFT_515611 [Ceratobasidium sp. AG-I]
MTTLVPGLYTLRHIQGFLSKGPAFATGAGVDQPIKVEPNTAQFSDQQTWYISQDGDKWFITGPIGPPIPESTNPAELGFHNDTVANGAPITLSAPVPYELDHAGDNIYTIRPTNPPIEEGVVYFLGVSPDQNVVIKGIPVIPDEPILAPYWYLNGPLVFK